MTMTTEPQGTSYVGKMKLPCGVMGLVVFAASEPPTPQTHPEYTAVLGPFADDNEIAAALNYLEAA